MIREELRETAVRYLNRSPLLHADMLDNIARGKADILRADEHGVLQKVGTLLMMSADSKHAAQELLCSLEEAPKSLEVHRDICRDAALKIFGMSVFISCRQAVWSKRVPLSPVRSVAEIRTLDKNYLPFVQQHYDLMDDPDYISLRLSTGDFLGAFFDGHLAGFIGTHEEGSMGMLEILPQYRRKGIASQLETALANRLLARGRVPFAQIEAKNEASLSLQRKLNFELSKEKIYWLDPVS